MATLESTPVQPAADWHPKVWCRPEVDAFAAQVTFYGTSYQFWVHDRADGSRILSYGGAETLEAAQIACDVALAQVLAQHADARAIAAQIADGGPAHEQEAA